MVNDPGVDLVFFHHNPLVFSTRRPRISLIFDFASDRIPPVKATTRLSPRAKTQALTFQTKTLPKNILEERKENQREKSGRGSAGTTKIFKRIKVLIYPKCYRYFLASLTVLPPSFAPAPAPLAPAVPSPLVALSSSQGSPLSSRGSPLFSQISQPFNNCGSQSSQSTKQRCFFGVVLEHYRSRFH